MTNFNTLQMTVVVAKLLSDDMPRIDWYFLLPTT